jgi:hypothetical protein
MRAEVMAEIESRQGFQLCAEMRACPIQAYPFMFRYRAIRIKQPV